MALAASVSHRCFKLCLWDSPRLKARPHQSPIRRCQCRARSPTCRDEPQTQADGHQTVAETDLGCEVHVSFQISVSGFCLRTRQAEATAVARPVAGRLPAHCCDGPDPARGGQTGFAVHYAFKTFVGTFDYVCMLCGSCRSEHAVQVYNDRMSRAFHNARDFNQRP